MEFILAFGNFIPLQGSCLTSIDDRYLLLFGGEMDLTYRKKSKALKLFDSSKIKILERKTYFNFFFSKKKLFNGLMIQE